MRGGRGACVVVALGTAGMHPPTRHPPSLADADVIAHLHRSESALRRTHLLMAGAESVEVRASACRDQRSAVLRAPGRCTFGAGPQARGANAGTPPDLPTSQSVLSVKRELEQLTESFEMTKTRRCMLESRVTYATVRLAVNTPDGNSGGGSSFGRGYDYATSIDLASGGSSHYSRQTDGGRCDAATGRWSVGA